MYDTQKRLKEIERVIAAGPYRDSWKSLSGYRVPAWYEQAKFGIFIHWGVYAVPAFRSEWYPRNMYIQGSAEYEHHIKTYGKHKTFGYKDFIPLFRAERYNADDWAELFERAGAKYVVPVAEHHDGFQMYKSELSHWNSFEMGPKIDHLGELKKACEKKGLMMGASSHRFEHWFFLGHGKEFDSDIHDPLQIGDFYWPSHPEPDHQDLFSTPAPDEEYMTDWLLRTCEIVDRYQPKVIYFDWWIQHSALKPYLKKFAAYYYNRAVEWGTEGVINYKHDAFLFGTAVPDLERGQFAGSKPFHWQTDTSVSVTNWCYTPDNVYHSAESILCNLIDIVSKNGNLLLNVGPKADGTIPQEERDVLLKIGGWLKENGEAIYGANVYRTCGEGPTAITEGQFSDNLEKRFTPADFRFTAANGCIYAIALKCSPDGTYKIKTFGEKDVSKQANFHGIIEDISVLGCAEKPRWERTGEHLLITTSFRSELPVVFRLTLC